MKIQICEVLTIKGWETEELEAFTNVHSAYEYGEKMIQGKEKELTYRIYPREVRE